MTEQKDNNGLSSASFPLFEVVAVEVDALPLIVYVAMQDGAAGDCKFDTVFDRLLLPPAE